MSGTRVSTINQTLATTRVPVLVRQYANTRPGAHVHELSLRHACRLPTGSVVVDGFVCGWNRRPARFSVAGVIAELFETVIEAGHRRPV